MPIYANIGLSIKAKEEQVALVEVQDIDGLKHEFSMPLSNVPEDGVLAVAIADVDAVNRKVQVRLPNGKYIWTKEFSLRKRLI